jgi:two-component system NtrC family sensor kinase
VTFAAAALLRALTVALSLTIAAVVWRRRAQPGAAPFAALMLSAGVWSAGALLEHAAVTPAVKVVFAALEYPAIMALAPLWLLFALTYTGAGSAFAGRRGLVLAVVPVVTVALVWTNPWHHLVWTSFTPSGPTAGAPLVYGHGPAFWAAATYNYVLLIAGTVVLVAALARLPALYRRQGVALLTGLALPWLGNALYLSGTGLTGGVDPTPLAFALTGVVYAGGVFGRRLFDLVPVARHALIESMSDGVLVLDDAGRVLDVNPSAWALLGLAPTAIGERVDAVLSAWPALVALARGGGDAGAEVHCDTPAGARDLHVRVTAVRDGRGRPRGRLLVLGDVTERRRTEDALRQSEKLAGLGQLLAGVAHELNNPLSVVIGHATLLRRELGEAPGGARVERIAAAAERCARIVTNFLAVARRRSPERASTDVNRVLRETVALLGYQLEVDNIAVTLDLGHDVPFIRADGHQLQQVVMNLVLNAHHALRAHDGARRITLVSRVAPGGGRVVFSVADSGPGIPPALRARVFEPFFTTKPVGVGTGLGLSVCRGIVEAHEGTIEIGEAEGGGALLTVELPVGDETFADEAGAPDAGVEPLRDQRILVVDDEPMVAELLRDILAPDGHRVEVAPHGRAALDLLAREPFDLIISDFRMPVLDGGGLYRELALRAPALRERFIFLSGDTLNAETRKFIERTGAPVLDKPFDAARVRRTVQQILHARRS